MKNWALLKICWLKSEIRFVPALQEIYFFLLFSFGQSRHILKKYLYFVFNVLICKSHFLFHFKTSSGGTPIVGVFFFSKTKNPVWPIRRTKIRKVWKSDKNNNSEKVLFYCLNIVVLTWHCRGVSYDFQIKAEQFVHGSISIMVLHIFYLSVSDTKIRTVAT